MKKMLEFFGVLGVITSPLSFVSNSIDVKTKLLSNNFNLNEKFKIDLKDIKTKNVKMDIGSLKGLTEKEIKPAVLLEVVKQNDSNKVINDVIMGAIYQPKFWDISGIRFVVPDNNKTDKYSAKITANDLNSNYANTLFVNIELTNKKIEDVSYNLNNYSKIKAVGKSWGTGKPNTATEEISEEINLEDFDGINLFRENYYSIDVSLYGEYFFKKGKKFEWSDYHSNKTNFIHIESFIVNNISDFGKWNEIKFVESNKGGYKWGNYYKAYIKLDFIGNQLVLKSKYQLAAYGVGANWYWSAGSIALKNVLFKAKNNLNFNLERMKKYVACTRSF